MVAVVEVTCESGLSTKAINTWHWRIPEANVSTEIAGIIGALDTFYEAVKLYLAPQTITSGSKVVTVDQNPNEEIGASALTCVTTGTTFDNLAGAAVCAYRAPLIGGRYRGRKYIGPLDEAATAANGRQLETAAQTVFFNALTTLGGFSTNGVEFGVWSPTYTTFTPATVFRVNSTLGIQRRRLT